MEKQGFDAKIYIGKAPFDQSGYHAWVMVITEDNYKIAIEATALTGGREKWVDRLTSIFDNKGRGVISYDENDVVAKRYYESNENSFKSIYEAVDNRGLEEWNWWEGAWGLN